MTDVSFKSQNEKMDMSGDHNESTHEIPKKSREDEEDSRLKNWQTWLEQWKAIEDRISQKLDVRSDELLVKYADGIKRVNEEKLLLQYAKIPTEFDKYRGKPDFWKLPLALPRRSGENKEPDYFAMQTEEERYIIPSIELIGFSKLIQIERNVINETRNIYKKWKNSEYRNEQMKKFASKITAIVPHKPHFELLSVVGVKISQQIDPNTSANVITLKRPSAAKKNHECVVSTIEPLKHCLKMGGILLNDSLESGSRKLRVNLEYDISAHETCVEYILFENTDVTTLRISWNKLKKFRIFRNYTEEKWDKHGFYFDKNDLVILPGQTVEFPIWFKTENAGTYSESWEITMRPRMWGDDFHVILVLHGYAYFKDLKDKVDAIVEYIDTQANNSLIKDMLLNVVEKVNKYRDVPIPPCVIYEEAQLFELANFANGRPLFLFNRSIVHDLQMFYDGGKIGTTEWNYAITELQALAHERDISLYHRHKQMEVEERIFKLQNSQPELKEKSLSTTKKGKKEKAAKKGKDKSSKGKSPKKLKENKSLSKTSQKNSSVVVPPPEVKKENYVYSNQWELWDIIKKLDSPVIMNADREKYFACTNVMSAYFNRMCHLLESLERQHEVLKNTNYPLLKYRLTPTSEQPERLVYEYFENDYIPNRTLEVYPFEAKPKPKILQDIPSEDVERIYATYFNKSGVFKKQESSSKKLGKKGKKDKKERSPKKDKKKGKALSKSTSRSQEGVKIKKEVSVECFNPYAENFVYVPEVETAENSDVVEETHAMHKTEDYKYRQYIIVYSCLSEAVDAIVDTVQSFECVASHETFDELKDRCRDQEKGKAKKR